SAASTRPPAVRREVHRDLERVFGVLAPRDGYRREPGFGPELCEDRTCQARLHLRAPPLEPDISVVVTVVLVAELRRELDVDGERPFLAVYRHVRAMIAA